jgi:hypothetical protein
VDNYVRQHHQKCGIDSPFSVSMTIKDDRLGTLNMINEPLTEGIADAALRREVSQPIGSEWKDKRFNLNKGYSFWLSRIPVRMFLGCGLPNTLSHSDKGKMYDCALLLQANTNMLFYHSHGEEKPLTVPKLADRLGMSINRCYDFVQHMCDLRVMARDNGRLYINPCYFFRGRYLSWHLYRLFEQDLESVLPDWVVARYNGDIHA